MDSLSMLPSFSYPRLTFDLTNGLIFLMFRLYTFDFEEHQEHTLTFDYGDKNHLICLICKIIILLNLFWIYENQECVTFDFDGDASHLSQK